MSRFVVIIYLLAYRLYRMRIPVVPELINRIFIRLLFSCYIGMGTQMGKNVRLGYGGLGVVIHKNSVIGTNVIIGSGVTLGGTPGKNGVPVIGDNCIIYNGAKIIGPVTIGRNAIVGANAVVLKDVPENCTVAGIPATIISRN